MTAPNRATLWGRAIADELAKAGVDAVCVAPGSRSTPLTVALDAHDELTVFSHLDERSAAFFALGRGKVLGRPTPVVCTSGTAAANFHPAVIEADTGRVPLLVLTADRPAELRDSGANQTVDQEKLYGDAVRFYRDLPEPAAEPRRLRSLRTTVCRAVAETAGAEPGPVHLNVPVAKPLEPTTVPAESPDGVPEDLAADHPLAARGRDGPFVDVHAGVTEPSEATLDRLAAAVDAADRGLLVAGPTDEAYADALVDLAHATGFPLLADPLSGVRYGPHVPDGPVLGGYDAYLHPDVTADWPDPDVVLRFGASPTSKPLRKYLARTGARQFVADASGGWREAEFRASDLVVADPAPLARALADRVESPAEPWPALDAAEAAHWALLDERDDAFEGRIAAAVAADAPDPATVFVSNSMPIRDLDRFARPDAKALRVLGNRGASGIDGVTSTALGAGSATDDPLVLLTGDLAYYHDLNGLLALSRCGVDATIALVNNDGGGIFHMLPIEQFDPPFQGQFKTPHGLDFEPTADLYGFDYARTDSLDAFRERYRASLDSAGTQVVEYVSDAEASHRTREEVREALVERLT
ncbi:2-succinyl-5-enolpyruvyl-6-hydroxy-3-cyclohexene-1-carboxylic-acid synthase [Halocalculus aciditolerans]|uniref:2-succinyl-5-enolpyruvyl-6-hydroxy-3-cyclohexene-1-carboxylate synthase n=1 Tax=Halocalculus aciditolerans TaxID=1383812 RepID=A0A830F2S8_9EURY|nr:2-succinyl-5-enolpyruvyl-6-hydroxy-3-cyclohexene-1-carboxylic-acid synthase [Halocalculus aciditolerans]GGL56888.1 2-succinyl-5-enolpyruvyl-6-hydroxy-3-cyclohexene-1-carboxylate synthase [Halocalculus aciditolerans]